MTAETPTAASNVTYNLVSVLYHALQAAETHDQYIKDAEQDGDSDLAQFFREVQEQDNERAERAKQLLVSRVQRQ